jgi:hypothetical protein
VYTAEKSAERKLGRTVMSWDGKSSAGTLAASGVYFFVLDAADKSTTGKFVIVRK